MQEAATQLDLDIEFHAVSCTAHGDLCKHSDIKSFPTIRLYKANQDEIIPIEYWKLHPFGVLRLLGIEVEGQGGIVDKHDNSKVIAKVKPVRSAETIARTKQDVYNDAFLSFDFALRTNIFLSTGSLEDSTRTAFDKWVDLLGYALPPTWKIQKTIRAIRDDFEEAVESEESLVKLTEDYRPEVTEWSKSCTKGEPHAGYTCGLWELFHIMTVGVYEYNLMVTTEWDVIHTAEAADILHDYIANFFTCEECRRNFLQSFDACDHDRCSRLGSSTKDEHEWKQLALWLWETHNGVNVRLMKEKAQREGRMVTEEDERRAMWPSRLQCSTCWREDGTWDDDTIFKFLRISYW